MKLYKLLYLFIAAIVINSCDVIDPPYTEENVQPPDDTTKFVQKVLIEDYTGHRCGNCPEAAEIAHELEDLHKGKVIVLAVHAGFYASTNSKFPTDFRTDVGNELDKKWEIGTKLGNPNGLVNRIELNGKRVLGPSYWDGAVTDALKRKPKMMINLDTDYDAASRKVMVTAEIEYKDGEMPTESQYLAIYLKENKIIAEQQDDRDKQDPIKEDYVHNHVLRASINNIWGEQIINVTQKEGNKYTVTYEYTIPQDKQWNPDNIYALAYIHDFEQSWEIYQVEEAKIISSEE